MQTLIYVLIGAATWTVAFALFGGTIAGSIYFFGPPPSDRADSFAFIAGGAITMLLAFITIGVVIAIAKNAH